MWKRKIKKCLALGLAFAMMTGVAGCGKEQHRNQFDGNVTSGYTGFRSTVSTERTGRIIIYHKCSGNLYAESERADYF